MTAPRLEIRLDRIHHNARILADRLGARGVSVTGVTKAMLGDLREGILPADLHAVVEQVLHLPPWRRAPTAAARAG